MRKILITLMILGSFAFAETFNNPTNMGDLVDSATTTKRVNFDGVPKCPEKTTVSRELTTTTDNKFYLEEIMEICSPTGKQVWTASETNVRVDFEITMHNSKYLKVGKSNEK